MWFENIAQLKAIVGSKLDAAVAFNGISPFITPAEEKYLIPKIGDLFWSEVNSLGIDEAINAKVLYRRALAWFTLAEHGKITLRQSENGLVRHFTETTATGSDAMMQSTIVEYLKNGYDALDLFLIYLEKNNIYLWGNWAESDEFLRYSNCFIRNAKDFSFASNRQIDRYTFEHLQQLCVDVQASMLQQFLPKVFYNTLKSNELDATNSGYHSSAHKGFVKFLQKAIAAVTLEIATRQNLVSFSGGTIVLIPNQMTTFSPTFLSEHKQLQKMQKNAYLGQAKAYAIENLATMQDLWSVADGGTNTEADAWTLITTTTTDETLNSTCCTDCGGFCDCRRTSRASDKKILVL